MPRNVERSIYDILSPVNITAGQFLYLRVVKCRRCGIEAEAIVRECVAKFQSGFAHELDEVGDNDLIVTGWKPPARWQRIEPIAGDGYTFENLYCPDCAPCVATAIADALQRTVWSLPEKVNG